MQKVRLLVLGKLLLGYTSSPSEIMELWLLVALVTQQKGVMALPSLSALCPESECSVLYLRKEGLDMPQGL